jgi:hypothetical protein
VQRRTSAARSGSWVATFRATRLPASLKHGGAPEKVASMANYAPTRTKKFYDRCRDEMSPGKKSNKE